MALTLRKRLQKAGLEPDNCFIFGDEPRRKRKPDLAIEVIWTSGGIEKLEIYRRLGVGEVWFWENNHISVHLLERTKYVEMKRSTCLPDLDLALIARLAVVEPTSAAILELREILHQGT